MKKILTYVTTSILLFIALVLMARSGGEHFDGAGILVGLSLI